MFEQKTKIQKREMAPGSQKSKEFSKESSRKEMVSALRAHLKKAITVAVFPIVFAAETVGFSKKDVEQKLNEQPTATQYLKHADTLSKEGDVKQNERAALFRAVERGVTLKRIFGESTLDELIGNTVPFKESVEHQKYPSMEGAAEDIDINVGSVHEALGRLPHHWIDKIEEIVFKDETRTMHPDYGIEGWTSARVEYDGITNRTTIFFYKLPPRWRTEEGVKEHVVHEVAHSNDWGDRERPVPERIETLYRVLARLSSAGRFRSGYVESIRNDDKGLELAVKVREYWAAIAAQYFVDKDVLPEQDRMLVEWRLAPPPQKYSKPHKEY